MDPSMKQMAYQCATVLTAQIFEDLKIPKLILYKDFEKEVCFEGKTY